MADKPESEFFKASNTLSGLHGSCKVCFTARQNKWKADNPGYHSEFLRIRRRANKRLIVKYYNNCCAHCGIVDAPCIYDLHHLNPKEKDFGIAQYLDRVWDKILPELQKCIMLCSNCHRKVHFS